MRRFVSAAGTYEAIWLLGRFCNAPRPELGDRAASCSRVELRVTARRKKDDPSRLLTAGRVSRAFPTILRRLVIE